MAHVKKCDRCGSIYKDKAQETYLIHSTWYNGHERTYDLCPHCGLKFQDFMWGKRLEGEKWEDGKVY